jgi:hypothetical protein
MTESQESDPVHVSNTMRMQITSALTKGVSDACRHSHGCPTADEVAQEVLHLRAHTEFWQAACEHVNILLGKRNSPHGSPENNVGFDHAKIARAQCISKPCLLPKVAYRFDYLRAIEMHGCKTRVDIWNPGSQVFESRSSNEEHLQHASI